MVKGRAKFKGFVVQARRASDFNIASSRVGHFLHNTRAIQPWQYQVGIITAVPFQPLHSAWLVSVLRGQVERDARGPGREESASPPLVQPR